MGILFQFWQTSKPWSTVVVVGVINLRIYCCVFIVVYFVSILKGQVYLALNGEGCAWVFEAPSFVCSTNTNHTNNLNRVSYTKNVCPRAIVRRE